MLCSAIAYRNFGVRLDASRTALKAHAVDAVRTTTREYLEKTAKISVPKRMDTLLDILDMRGEEILMPTERSGLNPFLIPLSRNKADNSLTCYIRWPTQKEEMDLQLVKTTDVGISLLAMTTDNYCHRLAMEMDFYADTNAIKAIDMLNKDGQLYTPGDYMPMFKSGKFPVASEEDMRLFLDRYLLTKVGPFPDSYQRIAQKFKSSGDEISALVTCERAVSVFYGWGKPITFHAMMLNDIPERDKEARDAARAAMGMPAWTVADSQKELEEIVQLAGFSGCKILGEMHAFRASDPRKDEVGEGLSPIQVTLDQCAHLMDAVAFGKSSCVQVVYPQIDIHDIQIGRIRKDVSASALMKIFCMHGIQ
jgi:hypothetical protein